MRLEWASIDGPLLAVDQFLTQNGVEIDDPVVLECGNSVPAALVLLALLVRGNTLVLLPPQPAAAQPLPGFLRHQIRVRSLTGHDGGLPDPAHFLELQLLEERQPLPSLLRRDRLLLRTSGSIAAPKLVVHSHAALIANARNAVERLALESSDCVSIPVPLAHMFGLGAGFLPALLAGAAIDLVEGANLIRYLERERIHRPTVAFFSPNLCNTLVRPRAAPGHYRHVVVAGDKLDPIVFQAAEGIYRRVVNLYGSTEMGVVCATDARAPNNLGKTTGETAGGRTGETTVGRPLPGVQLRLEAQTDGEPGELLTELLCAHPYGFEGYVDPDGRPLPRDPRLEEGWFATGDLAEISPDGQVELRGRRDHAVNRDGRLVMLPELERAIEGLPGVARVAIVIAGETRRGRAIVAFCIPREGITLEVGPLRQNCQKFLPAYVVPDEVHVLPALPSLPSGKLDRRALLGLLPSYPLEARPV